MTGLKPFLISVSIFALTAVAGCGGGGGSSSTDTGGGGGEVPRTDVAVVSYDQDVQPIFTSNCLSSGATTCHAIGGIGPFSLESSEGYTNLLSGPSPRVVAGDSASSSLFQVIQSGAMPPGLGTLAPEATAIVANWIDNGANKDLTIDLTAFTPHVGQLMEFRVVEDASGTLQSKIIVEDLPTAAFNYMVPSSVPPGAHSLDFFADFNNNGMYDQEPTDHEWTKVIPDTGVMSFAHDAIFSVIGATAPVEGLGFVINFTAMTPHVGQLLELRVIEDSTGFVVGAYRLGSVPAAAFTLTIPGIVDAGATYRAEFYADLNGNSTYDAPPADHAWSVTGTADATGLTIDFVHDVTTLVDINF